MVESLRYNQVRKVEIDKHSYEMQIKELADSLAEYKGKEGEVFKLKEAVHKLNIELEDYRRREQATDRNLAGKY